MNKSESIKNLAAALVAFNGEMNVVGYDSKNPFFKSKYASLTALVESSKPVLLKYGLAVTQLVGDTEIETVLLHSSGEWLSASTSIKYTANMKGLSDPQAFGIAVSYSRRYSFAAMLNLVTDEDVDGNHPANSPQKKQAAPAPQKPATPKNAKASSKQVELINKLLKSHVFSDEEKFKFHRIIEKGIDSPTAASYIDRITEQIAERKRFETMKPAEVTGIKKMLTEGEPLEHIVELMGKFNFVPDDLKTELIKLTGTDLWAD